MALRRGLVIEVNGRRTTVLTPEGDFLTVRTPSPIPAVGTEISFAERRPQTWLLPSGGVAAAAAVVLALVRSLEPAPPVPTAELASLPTTADERNETAADSAVVLLWKEPEAGPDSFPAASDAHVSLAAAPAESLSDAVLLPPQELERQIAEEVEQTVEPAALMEQPEGSAEAGSRQEEPPRDEPPGSYDWKKDPVVRTAAVSGMGWYLLDPEDTVAVKVPGVSEAPMSTPDGERATCTSEEYQNEQVDSDDSVSVSKCTPDDSAEDGQDEAADEFREAECPTSLCDRADSQPE